MVKRIVEGITMDENKEPVEEIEEPQKSSKLGWILFFSILTALVVACIVVILVLR